VTTERPDPFEPDPLGDWEPEDSWEPPDPALGGPGQLIVAVVVAFLVAAVLLAAVAGLSWFFQ
jgi:hypothetical protein